MSHEVKITGITFPSIIPGLIISVLGLYISKSKLGGYSDPLKSKQRDREKLMTLADIDSKKLL